SDRERRLPRRRLLRRRTWVRAVDQLADGPEQLERTVAQQLLADALCTSAAPDDHERGPPARREPLLPRGLEQSAGAAARHGVLPRALSSGAPRPRGRAVRNPVGER